MINSPRSRFVVRIVVTYVVLPKAAYSINVKRDEDQRHCDGSCYGDYVVKISFKAGPSWRTSSVRITYLCTSASN